jgi:ATP-dependent RNA helicase RhlB
LPEIETYIGHKIPTAVVTPEMLPPLERPSLDSRGERHAERGNRRGRDGRKERGARRERPARPPRQEIAAPTAAKPEPKVAPKAAKPIPKVSKSNPRSKTISRRFERPAVG